MDTFDERNTSILLTESSIALLLCSKGIIWRDLNLLLTNCTLSDRPPPEQRPLKASLHSVALDYNARTASSRLKTGIVTWLCPPPPPDTCSQDRK